MDLTGGSRHRAGNDIISKLQTDILRLQGFKQERGNTALDSGLGAIARSFPNLTFPTGCIHEFLTIDKASATASNAFTVGLVNALSNNSGVIVWISSSRRLFPPALSTFGLHPDRFIFIDLKKERDVLWAMDEALKCGALTAVIGEINTISFTESRRLQLAVEQSNVTGFLIRKDSGKIGASACVSRWKITSLPSKPIDDLPGVGFPTWRVELLRIRNGRPGVWNVVWEDSKFKVQDSELKEVAQKAESHKLQAASFRERVAG